MQLKEEDNGVEVTIRQAQEVAIALPENPMTGYQWVFELKGHSIAGADDAYAASGRKIGEGGTRKVRYVAQRFGITVIEAYLRRAWEGHEHAIKMYRVTVTVAG